MRLSRILFQVIFLAPDDGGAAGGGAAAGGAAGAGASGGAAAGNGSGAGAAAGGAGAAAGAAGAQGATGGDGQGAGAQPGSLAAAVKAGAATAPNGAEGGTPAAYYPEGLAETLRGANDKETIDKLAKHVGDLPRPPAQANEYKFTPAKEIAHLIANPGDDKVLPLFQKVAHGLGMSQAQFDGTINGLYSEMMQAGLIKPPVQVAQEFTKLGGETGSPADRMKKGEQRVADMCDKLDALATRKDITPEQSRALQDMTGSADAVLAIERLLSMLPDVGGGPRPGGQGGNTGITREQVEARMKDPRYIWNSPTFSQAFYDETNRLFETTPRR